MFGGDDSSDSDVGGGGASVSCDYRSTFTGIKIETHTFQI